MKPVYLGVFVDPSITEGCALSRRIEHPHITLLFKPSCNHDDLLGEDVTIEICGYANNGTNEGFLVSAFCENRKVQDMLDAIALPHITLSVSENGLPVDTARLHFKPCEHFTIHGTVGYFLKSGKVLLDN